MLQMFQIFPRFFRHTRCFLNRILDKKMNFIEIRMVGRKQEERRTYLLAP